MLSSTLSNIVDDHREVLDVERTVIPKTLAPQPRSALRLRSTKVDEKTTDAVEGSESRVYIQEDALQTRSGRREDTELNFVQLESNTESDSVELAEYANSFSPWSFGPFALAEEPRSTTTPTSNTSSLTDRPPTPINIFCSHSRPRRKFWRLKDLFRRKKDVVAPDSSAKNDLIFALPILDSKPLEKSKDTGILSALKSNKPVILRKIPLTVRFKDLDSEASIGHNKISCPSGASTASASSVRRAIRDPPLNHFESNSEGHTRMAVLQDMRKRSIYLSRDSSDVSSLGVPGQISVLEAVQELPYVVESFSKDMSVITNDFLRENFDLSSEEEQDEDSQSEFSTFYDGSSYGCNRANLYNICAALQEDCATFAVCH